ncbi:SPOR domain-containing protein [Thioclava litoralis]|uniref:SPOR domain-containing protein n=1 Tax=Thioclava litoralis TaxID=3076557 RepID=A0ABZ1DZM0_9RHOB|nr:SPOR domain-containing protein [Thioclava sp. FTW29]
MAVFHRPFEGEDASFEEEASGNEGGRPRRRSSSYLAPSVGKKRRDSSDPSGESSFFMPSQAFVPRGDYDVEDEALEFGAYRPHRQPDDHDFIAEEDPEAWAEPAPAYTPEAPAAAAVASGASVVAGSARGFTPNYANQPHPSTAGGFDPRYGAEVFDDDEPALRPNPFQRWVNLAGAATSVALILGVVVWGYKLAMRDIQGVPVIKAMEGPSRVAPEDPGGELAEHVGLSVNGVAGTGVAAPAPERVTLAPAEAGLSDDDKAMSDLKPIDAATAPMETDETPETIVVPVPDSNARPTPEMQGATQSLAAPGAVDEATADSLTNSDSNALVVDDADGTGDDGAVAPPSPEAISQTIPGVIRSPRPMLRPARDLVAEAVAASFGGGADASTPSESEGPVEIDAASLPAGTRLVQLNTYQSADEARKDWDRVVTKFGPLMDGKKRVIQEATAGGRTFYRLRVQGFEDLAQARQFCAALVAEGASCIPATVR